MPIQVPQKSQEQLLKELELMEQTQPSNSVPVNNLAKVLKNARSIMHKVESGDYETGNVDSRLISEDRMKEAVESGEEPPTRRMPKMKEAPHPKILLAIGNDQTRKLLQKRLIKLWGGGIFLAFDDTL